MASLSIDTQVFRGRIAACVAGSLALHLVALAIFEISGRTHSRRAAEVMVPVELRFAPVRKAAPASPTQTPPAAKPAAPARSPSPALNKALAPSAAPPAALGALWSDVCHNFSAATRKRMKMPDCAPARHEAGKAAVAALRARTQEGLDALAVREGWDAGPPLPQIIADPAKARGAILPSSHILGIARPVPIIRLAANGKGAKLSGLGVLGAISPPQAPVTAVTRLADDYRFRAAEDRAARASR